MINAEEYLKKFYKGTKNPSLNGMKYFMNCYNNFADKMNFIHIAGTNGKGSCTEMMSNILKLQGYKVGKFISPHLIKYNERISINNKDISDKEMSDLLEELSPKIEEYNNYHDIDITLFELETIMALLYFYRNNVDFVILETGLGGLYDCTNIISNPIVSIITSVGYDHVQILGNTLPKIAYQKAGIIKQNSSTVVFEQIPDVNEVFIKKCNELNNKLHIVSQNDIYNYYFENDFQYFDYKQFKQIAINLKGKVQIQNASLCLETICILRQKGYKVSLKSIKKGLSTVIHRGRMEILNKNPLIIYDGAHNEPAIKNLKETINMYYSKFEKIFVISILKRKDYNTMLKLLSEYKNAIFILTSGDDPDRYASSKELFNCLINYVERERIIIKDINQALEFVVNKESNTVNFIVGSFYTYNTVITKVKEINNDRN